MIIHRMVLLVVLMTSATAGGLLGTEVKSKDEKTCHASTTPNEGFAVCLHNSSNNVIANGATNVGNALFSLEDRLNADGSCYCSHHCTPPQIVCDTPDFLENLLSTITGEKVNLFNELSKFIYGLQDWTLYCYCPMLTKVGKNPCVSPPVKPRFCDPVE